MIRPLCSATTRSAKARASSSWCKLHRTVVPRSRAWLRSNDVNLATIGLFALIGLPYTWKFVWSPLMDRYKLPFLGRRRGWALLTQLVLLLAKNPTGANETVRPKAGRRVMFPAWILHQVRPYRGKAERISIALNLSL